jgi:hypothetical protein
MLNHVLGNRIIVGLIIAVATLAVHQIGDREYRSLLIAAALALLVVGFYAMVQGPISTKIFNTANVPELGWLYQLKPTRFSLPTLFRFEASVPEGSIIYIVTLDLELDGADREMMDIVSKNLKERKVTYIFLVPKDRSDDVNRRYQSFIDRQVGKGRLAILAVSKESLQTFVSNNLMFVRAGSELTGFLQIPEGSQRWWCRMSRQATDNYFANLQEELRQITHHRARKLATTKDIEVVHCEPPDLELL